MVVDVALYTLLHQPRRLKLPAQPIPRGASLEDITRCLFDDRLNERSFRQVAQSCYYPAARLFLDLVREQGLRMALGFTLSFVRQAERWEPALLELLRELAAEEGVEIVGTDPYHSLHCLIDLPGFTMRMRWMADEIERIFGKRPTVTDTTEMCMSASIYDALDAAGFRGTFIEGCPRLMQWRSSNYLYRYDDELPGVFEIKMPPRTRRSSTKTSERDRLGPPYTSLPMNEHAPCLLVRHQELSADVGLRFSNSAWSGYPLYADTYAQWIAQAQGNYVLLAWDFETFGEYHASSSGIFEFMRALPNELRRHGLAIRTPGELIENYADEHAYHLPLPVQPVTCTDVYGPDSLSSSGPQRDLLQLMHDVYNLARLTENPDVLDLAIWLAQSDHLHPLHWPAPQLADSVAPQEWRRLGVGGLLWERRQVYLNALHALEPYLPTRLMRQKSPLKAPRRKSALEQEQVEVLVRKR